MKLVSDGILGCFRVVEDVELERVGSKSITIVAGIRIPLGERMVLRSMKNGAWRDLLVRAVKRRTGIVAGRMQHDLVLQVDGVSRRRRRNAPGRNARVDVNRTKSGYARVAALLRDIPVRLVDLSVSGCVLEVPEFIDEGKVGSLETVIKGQRYSEIVRTGRSFRMEGVWPWTTGVQFLTLAPPSAASLRRVALIVDRS